MQTCYGILPCFIHTCLLYGWVTTLPHSISHTTQQTLHALHIHSAFLGHSACRYIKLTSPLINVVMCVGALLFYTTMVLLGVPTTSIDVQSALCNVSTSKLHHHMASLLYVN